MAKKTYTVVNAVVHNDDRYEPGEPIDLDDKFAAPLLDRGAIAPAADDKADKADKK